MDDYPFDWDPAKEQLNLRNHGVDFHEATSALMDEYASSQLDDRFE